MSKIRHGDILVKLPGALAHSKNRATEGTLFDAGWAKAGEDAFIWTGVATCAINHSNTMSIALQIAMFETCPKCL